MFQVVIPDISLERSPGVWSSEGSVPMYHVHGMWNQCCAHILWTILPICTDGTEDTICPGGHDARPGPACISPGCFLGNPLSLSVLPIWNKAQIV